jgi:hypothetical protein
LFHGALFQAETVSRGTRIFEEILEMASNKEKDINASAPGSDLFREKRKWQIALRRYVLERNMSVYYAPYFGLDIESMRRWFECQFNEGVSWESFGKNWQFDHVVPVFYFDFSNEQDLALCWNFINLRVGYFKDTKEKGIRPDLLAARKYCKELYEATGFEPCLRLINKIDQIEMASGIGVRAQQSFIKDHSAFLEAIKGYSGMEFELLNRGRTVDEVRKELEFVRQFEK